MRAIQGLTTAAALLSVACMPPEWGANGLLHPTRRRLGAAPELPHEDVVFRSDGLLLKGWLFHANGARRGLIVHLHGVADNRGSGVGIAQRFVPKGYDVFTYDSRAHGESEGEECRYGFYEKRDLSRALDAIRAEEAVLFGSSLGAAVALQAAAEDRRVRGVIAQSPFSDLETIARERAPWVATPGEIAETFAIAERKGHFRIAEVSPRLAASRIHVPLLLIYPVTRAAGRITPRLAVRAARVPGCPRGALAPFGRSPDSAGVIGPSALWRASRAPGGGGPR